MFSFYTLSVRSHRSYAVCGQCFYLDSKSIGSPDESFHPAFESKRWSRRHCCCCVHGPNFIHYWTRLPIRFVVCWTGKHIEEKLDKLKAYEQKSQENRNEKPITDAEQKWLK